MENTFIFQVLDVCRCCRMLQHPEYGCNIACAKACEWWWWNNLWKTHLFSKFSMFVVVVACYSVRDMAVTLLVLRHVNALRAHSYTII